MVPPAKRSGDQNSERRRADRIAARIEVRFSDQDQAAKAFQAYSINLSVGGMCLRTSREYEVGARLQLTLKLDSDEFFVKGVVAWRRGGAVGVRFVDVSDQDAEKLNEILGTLTDRDP